MSDGVRVTWNHEGIRDYLVEQFEDDIINAAHDIAAAVESATGLEATVETHVTDRPHSVVMLHYGAAIEATQGPLARAATAHGFKVGAPSPKQLARAAARAKAGR